MTLNLIRNVGPPKINKKASKKNKKSWRKNIDVTDVENAMEEERFEERVGGSFEKRESKDLFMVDTTGENEGQSKKNKKELKPLKCFSLLEGLPGVPDPRTQRTKVRSMEERENPVVKKKKLALQESGFVSKKARIAQANREAHKKMKKATELDRTTRRRTKFDFDLWGDDGGDQQGIDNSWVNPETKVHTQTWTSKLVPKEAKNRSVKSQTLLPAVEVPHPGQSYNPSLADHQDVLWKAAMVEIDKEKQAKKIERQTTGMFPTKNQAPTHESILKEMSEGIAELGGVTDDKDEDGSDEEQEKAPQEEEEEKEKVDGATPFKPKTRQQRRKMKVKSAIERKALRHKLQKLKENEVFTVKSIKKDMKVQDENTKVRQKRKAERAVEKLKNPIQLSNYKYQPQELEVKLSDELSGNLRNLKQEGSVLEDRYKSLQRRNIVETRIVHKACKGKRKIVDKRAHKMGFEDDLRKLKNQVIQKKRSRQMKKAAQRRR